MSLDLWLMTGAAVCSFVSGLTVGIVIGWQRKRGQS